MSGTIAGNLDPVRAWVIRMVRTEGEFNLLDESAIREISYIGFGNTMTALSVMKGRTFSKTLKLGLTDVEI